jgi:hypothetical protein
LAEDSRYSPGRSENACPAAKIARRRRCSAGDSTVDRIRSNASKNNGIVKGILSRRRFGFLAFHSFVSAVRTAIHRLDRACSLTLKLPLPSRIFMTPDTIWSAVVGEIGLGSSSTECRRNASNIEFHGTSLSGTSGVKPISAQNRSKRLSPVRYVPNEVSAMLRIAASRRRSR